MDTESVESFSSYEPSIGVTQRKKSGNDINNRINKFQLKEFIYPKESKSIGQKLKKNIKNINNISNKLRTEIKKKQKQLRHMTANVLKRVSNQNVQISLDKFTYCIALLILNVTASLLFHPKTNFLRNWIIITILGLTIFRFAYFRSSGYHYYFFDYGYIVNLAYLVVLMFYPNNLEYL